jgi:hypothetical protein
MKTHEEEEDEHDKYFHEKHYREFVRKIEEDELKSRITKLE